MIRFLSSLKLTLSLLLGLSAVSIIGTIRPDALGRFDLFYQSLWFRALLTLLALNMTVCTVKTIRRNLGDRTRYLDVLGGELVYSGELVKSLPGEGAAEQAAEKLKGKGCRLYRQDGKIVASKGRLGRWGSTVVHLSFLAIMFGALLAETGFVGTLNIYVGDRSAVYFDWDRQQDLPLPFEFRLDYFEPVYYPIEVRFGVLDSNGKQLQAYEVKEGEEVDLPLPGHRARLLKFLPAENQLIFGIYQGGRYLGEYHATPTETRFNPEIDLPIKFQPIAYRDPILKQLRSEVSILKKGHVAQQGTILINHPLVHDGIAIYQTAYDRDKFGNWFAGFQFSRDPGEPIVWAGCILMMIGLLLAFVIPCRAVGIVSREGEVLLVALAGFRGEEGREAFERLVP